MENKHTHADLMNINSQLENINSKLKSINLTTENTNLRLIDTNSRIHILIGELISLKKEIKNLKN